MIRDNHHTGSDDSGQLIFLLAIIPSPGLS